MVFLVCTPACPVIQRAGIKLPSPREHSGRNSKWELPRKRGQGEQVAGESENVSNYVYLLTHFKVFSQEDMHIYIWFSEQRLVKIWLITRFTILSRGSPAFPAWAWMEFILHPHIEEAV